MNQQLGPDRVDVGMTSGRLVGCSVLLDAHAIIPGMNLGLCWHRHDLTEDMVSPHLSLPRQIQCNRQSPPMFYEHLHSFRPGPPGWSNANVFADSDCG